MKRRPLWLILIAAMGVLACQLLANPIADPPTPTVAAPSLPTVLPTADNLPTATPLISAPPTDAAPTEPVVEATPGCSTWFFTFRAGFSEAACPEPVVEVAAVGEDFVGGRVYRYGPTPDFPDQRGTIFVIYNNGTWETYADTFAPGDANSDPNLRPPSNRVQPTGAIGKVWREKQGVRAELGWGYGPELPFTGRYQNPQGDSRNIYVDHGKGLVLRLSSVNMGAWTWDVAGDY